MGLDAGRHIPDSIRPLCVFVLSHFPAFEGAGGRFVYGLTNPSLETSMTSLFHMSFLAHALADIAISHSCGRGCAYGRVWRSILWFRKGAQTGSSVVLLRSRAVKGSRPPELSYSNSMSMDR